MDAEILEIFDKSLGRCNARPGFLDRFYERFLAMSPKVAEKFKHTDFVRQKRALRASFHMMLLAAGDGRTSLIVLSTSGLTGTPNVLGSTTDRVVRASLCPVLAYPSH